MIWVFPVAAILHTENPLQKGKKIRKCRQGELSKRRISRMIFPVLISKWSLNDLSITEAVIASLKTFSFSRDAMAETSRHTAAAKLIHGAVGAFLDLRTRNARVDDRCSEHYCPRRFHENPLCMRYLSTDLKSCLETTPTMTSATTLPLTNFSIK